MSDWFKADVGSDDPARMELEALAFLSTGLSWSEWARLDADSRACFVTAAAKLDARKAAMSGAAARSEDAAAILAGGDAVARLALERGLAAAEARR